MVLSHLILNDMMKVKGHIAGLARCLLDEDVSSCLVLLHIRSCITGLRHP
jgi:hypothetical protein